MPHCAQKNIKWHSYEAAWRLFWCVFAAIRVHFYSSVLSTVSVPVSAVLQCKIYCKIKQNVGCISNAHHYRRMHCVVLQRKVSNFIIASSVLQCGSKAKKQPNVLERTGDRKMLSRAFNFLENASLHRTKWPTHL